jgi:hypothetical protein
MVPRADKNRQGLQGCGHMDPQCPRQVSPKCPRPHDLHTKEQSSPGLAPGFTLIALCENKLTGHGEPGNGSTWKRNVYELLPKRFLNPKP